MDVNCRPIFTGAQVFLWVSFLTSIVSLYEVWFGSVHFYRKYDGKTLPEYSKVITIARLADDLMSLPNITALPLARS